MPPKKPSAQSILFAEDSHAKMSLKPTETELALQVFEPVFGKSSTESFASYDPNSQSLKTLEASLMGVVSKRFLGILPSSGTMRNGQLYARPRLEPYIREREFSLLPTPTARDGMVVGSFSLKVRAKVGKEKGSTAMLPEVLAAEFMWSHHPEFAEWMMGFPLTWTDLKR